MNTLVCRLPGEFEYQQRQAPVLTEAHAIIKILRVGICGTDLHAYRGTQPFFKYPRVFGHELAGELIEFDRAPGFEAGEKVTLIPYFSCGACIACRLGKPNCCEVIKVCGVHIDGGMAEFLSVPSYSLVHGEQLSYDELALVEPLAIGAHGVKRAQVRPGEFALVIGAGPIGLAIYEFLYIAGAKVIIMDINDQRLAYCRDKQNAPYTINPHTTDAVSLLREITLGDLPTVVFDASGSRDAIINSFNYIAHGGRYILVGLQKDEICFSHPGFHKKEGTLMSSRNATRKDFEYVIKCMKDGLVKPTHYLTHQVRFDQVKDEFDHWLDPSSGVMKAMAVLENR